MDPLAAGPSLGRFLAPQIKSQKTIGSSATSSGDATYETIKGLG
jgi:hypothetical protein